MGSLILCHKKHAEHPYQITRIHRRIYTLEELCYYLCNNLYLVDYTIMNDKLCQWLNKELRLEKLAEQLNELLKNNDSIEKFVLCILEYSRIYTDSELIHITNVLEKLKNQKDVERQKFMGDNLLQSGELEPAILVYQSILRAEKDETVDRKFYGRIYGCLGAAYGRAMLYEEAAKMYEAAYDVCREYSMVVAYLYACSQFMSSKDYREIIDSNVVFARADNELEARKKTITEANPYHFAGDQLAKWKKMYRRI